MNRIKSYLGLNTVRKKVLLLSKIVGAAIVLFYLLTSELAERSVAFWIWFILMVGIILGVDYWLGKMISKPLNIINDTAKQMAELDFTARCDVDTGDEFKELSDSLNAMFSNLKDTLGELEAANMQLEKDVERERLLLQERKELTDSLSHEMKTPIGLISAYTEGLREERDEKKRQKYIDSIMSATVRMNNMIVSMLDLSALEAGAARLTPEKFDIIELIETVAGRLLLDTPGSDFHINYSLPDQAVFVYTDYRRMEQVISNYIENARKYVRSGGEIRLEAKQKDNHLYFSVFNECNPIPQHKLHKIWNKFYRGQNSGPGGSGLGLAIVSQVLSMCEVPYGVSNKENGVEFYFQFPIA